jgi:hypothetical protein
VSARAVAVAVAVDVRTPAVDVRTLVGEPRASLGNGSESVPFVPAT